MITTSDVSCTKPQFTAGVGVNFKTGRLSAATNTAGTREGYIEIFNMADAPGVTAGTVGAAVTHSAATGKPTCAGVGYTTLDAITDNTTAVLISGAVADTPNLILPTTGLTANWIVINTTTGTSWSGQAQATQALTAGGVPANGNLVYWPQLSTAVVHATAGSSINGLTADPLLQAGGTVAATMQDLPDMSTPYISGLTSAAVGAATNLAIPFGTVGTAYGADADGWAARRQASRLSASLAVMSVNNDFYVDSAIGGATDWAFSMPTRRYNIAVNYATPVRVVTDFTFGNVTATAGTAGAIGGFTPVNYFALTNTTLSGNVICTTGISPTVYNREEGSLVVTTSTTFSPSSAPAAVSFCGEVGVWGLGQTLASGGFTAVLGSGIPNVAQTVGVNNYGAGWMNVGTTGIGGAIGLPVVGAAFSKASSDPAKTYGWSQPHTSTRVAGYVY